MPTHSFQARKRMSFRKAGGGDVCPLTLGDLGGAGGQATGCCTLGPGARKRGCCTLGPTAVGVTTNLEPDKSEGARCDSGKVPNWLQKRGDSGSLRPATRMAPRRVLGLRPPASRHGRPGNLDRRGLWDGGVRLEFPGKPRERDATGPGPAPCTPLRAPGNRGRRAAAESHPDAEASRPGCACVQQGRPPRGTGQRLLTAGWSPSSLQESLRTPRGISGHS